MLKALESTMDKPTPAEVEAMKNQVKLLREGFIVYVTDVGKSSEDSNHINITVTLRSPISDMQIFGDIELKISKQVVGKLKQQLSKVS